MTQRIDGSASVDPTGHTGRKVLVVSTLSRSPEVLREAVGGEIDELRVVVPMVRQSRLQWLTNADDQTREQAEGAAAELGRGLPSKETESTAGDSDPLVAVQDALRDFAADEVVVVTRPQRGGQVVGGGQGPCNREAATRRTGHETRAQRLGPVAHRSARTQNVITSPSGEPFKKTRRRPYGSRSLSGRLERVAQSVPVRNHSPVTHPV
jgi:hypothetical protein